MKRICIIDDSVIVLEAVQTALGELGYEIIPLVEPSRKALLGSPPPDLILLDIKMPQAFGDDIARFIREVWGVTTPIYLYSSLPEEELSQRTKEANVDGYICKDWGIARLVTHVKMILGELGSEAADQPPEGSDSPEAIFQDDSVNTPLFHGQTISEKARNIYHSYAHRCESRRARLMNMLSLFSEGEEEEEEKQLTEAIELEVHDWLGETKLLEFNKLADTLAVFQDVIIAWGINLLRPPQKAQLMRWITTFAEMSHHFALEAPDSNTSKALRNIRAELKKEVANTSSSKTITSELPKIEDTRRRILIFDDSPIIGEILLLELEARNHRVALAANLAEFEHHLASFDPEVICLDINMPEIQGDEMCRRLRKRFPDRRVPIILLSSIPIDELAVIAKEAEADGILSKQRGIEEIVRYLDWLFEEILVQELQSES